MMPDAKADNGDDDEEGRKEGRRLRLAAHGPRRARRGSKREEARHMNKRVRHTEEGRHKTLN
jgi:hypothetical protein